MKKIKLILKASNPPVVELDSEAQAAYIRFSKNKVAKTLPLDTESVIVTADFDLKNNVIGIELTGVHEFSIKALLKIAGVKKPEIPPSLFERTKYVSSNAVPIQNSNRSNSLKSVAR